MVGRCIRATRRSSAQSTRMRALAGSTYRPWARSPREPSRKRSQTSRRPYGRSAGSAAGLGARASPLGYRPSSRLSTLAMVLPDPPFRARISPQRVLSPNRSSAQEQRSVSFRRQRWVIRARGKTTAQHRRALWARRGERRFDSLGLTTSGSGRAVTREFFESSHQSSYRERRGWVTVSRSVGGIRLLPLDRCKPIQIDR